MSSKYHKVSGFIKLISCINQIEGKFVAWDDLHDLVTEKVESFYRKLGSIFFFRFFLF